MGWIVQGIEKVVPQPDEKYRKQPEPEDVTEVMKEPHDSWTKECTICMAGWIIVMHRRRSTLKKCFLQSDIILIVKMVASPLGA